MGRQTARLRVPADFGLAIQQGRMVHGLSQTQLAEELDISQSAISEIENGKSTIHLKRILQLARLTGVDFTASWEDGQAEALKADALKYEEENADAPHG